MITRRKTTIDGLVEKLAKQSLTVPGVQLGTTPWVAPVFLNSWANYEAAGTFETAAYRKNADNLVTLRGLIKHPGATPAAEAFALPAGFRPSKQKVFVCWGILATLTSGVMRVDVAPSGAVVVYGDAAHATEYLSLAGISFYAD